MTDAIRVKLRIGLSREIGWVASRGFTIVKITIFVNYCTKPATETSQTIASRDYVYCPPQVSL